MASINGSVWSCRECNVTNIDEASREIAKDRENALALENEIKSLSSEVTKELSAIDSLSSQVDSSNESSNTSTGKSSSSESDNSSTSSSRKRSAKSHIDRIKSSIKQ